MPAAKEGLVFVTPLDFEIFQCDYDGNNNLIYLGRAIKGSSTSNPVWAILKITYDGNNNLISILESPSYSGYGDIWANRTSLTYN